jgi:hypothetical protein
MTDGMTLEEKKEAWGIVWRRRSIKAGAFGSRWQRAGLMNASVKRFSNREAAEKEASELVLDLIGSWQYQIHPAPPPEWSTAKADERAPWDEDALEEKEEAWGIVWRRITGTEAERSRRIWQKARASVHVERFPSRVAAVERAAEFELSNVGKHWQYQIHPAPPLEWSTVKADELAPWEGDESTVNQNGKPASEGERPYVGVPGPEDLKDGQDPPDSTRVRLDTIRELEARGNRLGDECGRLKTLCAELEIENSRLRRAVERLERKAGR